MTKLGATPSQTVGPFFHLGVERAAWGDLTASGPRGERIVIEGRITDGDGAAVGDAFLELWQANAAGRYDHPADRQDEKPLDPGFHGFARVVTDAAGEFHVATIRPGAVPGSGNALQAPHINVALFGRGLLKPLFTRIYFAGEAANDGDPLLLAIEDRGARQTLIAARQPGAGLPHYRFDIVLQGEGETAFLDL
jgi:protocatechuate 3,4-dioxygenase alpha subunit